jgi:hypothetical protein
MREFHDRFVSVRDRTWFVGLLSNTEFGDATPAGHPIDWCVANGNGAI